MIFERQTSIDFNETQDLWKSGFEKALKIGRKTWWLRKNEKERHLNFNTNKLKLWNKWPWQILVPKLMKLWMVLMSLKEIWLSKESSLTLILKTIQNSETQLKLKHLLDKNRSKNTQLVNSNNSERIERFDEEN